MTVFIFFCSVLRFMCMFKSSQQFSELGFSKLAQLQRNQGSAFVGWQPKALQLLKTVGAGYLLTGSYFLQAVVVLK